MSMNVDYKAVEYGYFPADLTATLVAGRAVYLGTTTLSGASKAGKITTPVAAARVMGLIKENQISGVLDEVSGTTGGGLYGSGLCSVLTVGVATIQQTVVNGVSYNVYDQTQTYNYGDELYATPATGVVTNQTQPGMGPNGITSLRVGRVLKTPANPANGNPMQISVECFGF